MFTIPCETIMNQHPRVYRSALVGVGAAGSKRPIIVVELWPDQRCADAEDRQQLIEELVQWAGRHDLTKQVVDVLIHDGLPVDIRHNSKIFREQLSAWATGQEV